ncbi:bifunctional DNA primase/polymerase [Ktedonobacteria bacterium brp13]|nr:bifunctional DNA primase/polymerase [Ktedonobacteria bacterium brp13]
MRRTMRVTYSLPTRDYSLSLLYAALDYARKGYRVFPLHSCTTNGRCTCGQRSCRRPGLHPLIPGLSLATTDPVTIARWWHQYEFANVGLATGDGLLVIEVDPRQGGDLEAFMQFYVVPDTAIARTSEGCWQLYFTYNPAFVLRATIDKFGPGTRSYGDGCYVVAPPSRSGDDAYSWLNTNALERLPTIFIPTLLSSQIARQSWSPDFHDKETATPAHASSPAARALSSRLIQRPLLWQELPEQDE